VELPPWQPLPGSRTVFHFEPWFTWMDPLDHANHPAYLDWCDEAISRVMAESGLSPVALRPVAEKLTFRAGATALVSPFETSGVSSFVQRAIRPLF